MRRLFGIRYGRRSSPWRPCDGELRTPANGKDFIRGDEAIDKKRIAVVRNNSREA
jgi:hypothetical protein